MEYPKFKVTVSCMTYNHSKFITDAMNGFTMQQTSFPFVCTIVDDASTDGEQDVIRKYVEENFDFSEGSVAYHKETDYAHITYAQHKTNKNCYFAVLYLKENHYSQRKDKMGYLSEWLDMCEYEAICEGDDYWIAHDKIQHQVDFLNENKEYVMVHTDYDLVDGVRRHYKEIYDDGEYLPRGIYNNGFNIGTMSVLFRMDVFNRIPKYYKEKNWMMEDKPLWFELAHEGKIKYIPQVTAKYRVLTYSASHSRDLNRQLQFIEDGIEITRFYADKYKIQLNTDFKDKAYYVKVMKNICNLESKKHANKYFLAAIKNGHYSNKLLFFYICTQCPLLKKSIIKIFNYSF